MVSDVVNDILRLESEEMTVESFEELMFSWVLQVEVKSSHEAVDQVMWDYDKCSGR